MRNPAWNRTGPATAKSHRRGGGRGKGGEHQGHGRLSASLEWNRVSVKERGEEGSGREGREGSLWFQRGSLKRRGRGVGGGGNSAPHLRQCRRGLQ